MAVLCLGTQLLATDVMAQSFPDTAAVLAGVGTVFAGGSGGGAAVLFRGLSQPMGPFHPHDEMRYAAIVADSGRMPLLAQQPEAPCDTAADRSHQRQRPWLRSSLIILSISFAGDSATVIAGQDMGDNACVIYRNTGDWSYTFRRTPGGWSLVRVEQTRWS